MLQTDSSIHWFLRQWKTLTETGIPGLVLRLALCGAIFLSTVPVMADEGGPGDPSYIVGGEESEAGEFPFVASIGDDDSPSFCTASVVGERWVLTAAHCVANDDGSLSAPPSSIHVNINTLDANLDENRRSVSHILVHPDYDGSPTAVQSAPDLGGTADFPEATDFFSENDVALLRLTSAAGVEPIRLLGDDEQAAAVPGTPAHVVGYGYLCFPDRSCDNSERLYDGATTLADDQTAFDWASAPLCEDGVCTRRTPFGPDVHIAIFSGASTCFGDSGGPLLVSGSDGAWRQVGVTSWGRGPCPPDSFSVFAQVTNNAIYDWIDAVLNPETITVEFLRARVDLAYSANGSQIAPKLRLSANRSGTLGSSGSAEINLPYRWGYGNWIDLDSELAVEMLPGHSLYVAGHSTVPGPPIDLSPEIDWSDPLFDKHEIRGIPEVLDGFVTASAYHAEPEWSSNGVYTVSKTLEHGTLELEYRIRGGPACLYCVSVERGQLEEAPASQTSGSDITGGVQTGGTMSQAWTRSLAQPKLSPLQGSLGAKLR